MDKYKQIMGGLLVLSKYDQSGFHIAAEHDILYAGPTFDELPPEVEQQMLVFGWHKSDADCWAIFV